MYRAAICDDEPEVLLYLKESLKKEFTRQQIEASFDLFTDGDALLAAAEKEAYQILFMDIEMPGPDGIEVCRRIRAHSDAPLLIFISNKDELVFQSFEVRPFRFVRKTEFSRLLPSLTKDIADEFRRSRRRFLQITEPSSGDVFSFDTNRIRYLEAQGKQCLVYSDERTVSITIPFHEIEKLFAPYPFVKPHRSYLVNCHYIFRFRKNDMELTDGTILPVSRLRLEDARQKFLDNMNREV